MSDDAEEPRQDTRKTSAEKLEKLREIANEMAAIGARDPADPGHQKVTWYAERINRVLDGEWA